MQNISLDFFGEKITTMMPTDLTSLRSIIAEKFMFNPEDAAEVLITYMKDLGKKVIKTEEDFRAFLKEKINLITLDISQDSKLYKENFASIEEENSKRKNELDNLSKKKEEIISEKRKKINEFNKNIKSIDEQIKKLQNERKNEKNNMKNEITKLNKEEKDINNKIADLKEKLGIKDDQKEIIKKAEEKRKIKIKKKQEKEKKRQTKEKKRQEKEKRKQEKKNSADKKQKKSIDNKEQKKSVEKEEDKKEDEKDEKKEDQKEEQKEGFNPIINFKPINDVINMLGAFFQKDKSVHFPVSCNGCGAFPIIGNRFKCTVCENFNYCENCEAKLAGQHQHPFLKISKPWQNPLDFNFISNEEKK